MNIYDFLEISAVSVMMIFISCLTVYEVFRIIWSILPRMHVPTRVRVILIIIPVFAVHIFNIWLYAFAYFIIENYTAIGMIVNPEKTHGIDLQTFLDCLYFSSATYTTLGFGDVLPTRELRMLTAAEALNGLVLLGWTISFTYLAMENFWKIRKHEKTF